MIIAIDGPAGTGKSTVAKGVAKRLGFTFFDTGAMYRSFAWLVLEEGKNPQDAHAVCSVIPNFKYEILTDGKGERHYWVNGTDITHFIRTPKISTASSQVAVYPQVRRAMVEIQRKFGASVDAVFEGRDMGTVVFPHADVKIFLTAKPEVRAQRRFHDLHGKVPFEQILKETIERDANDMNRAVSPLKQAPDAVAIDTSDLTADHVVEKIVALLPKPKMKWMYWVVIHFARFYFKLFYRLKVYGIEHFKPGAALIASNHVSFYDPPVLACACPQEVHFLARAGLFEIPFLGWLIKKLNSHPVARGASDAQTFRTMIDLLNKGQKWIVFPEGQRSFEGDLLPIERGVAFLAQKAKCRILPAYIKGAHKVWPRKRRFPRLFGKITVTFGPSIEWSEFEHMDRKEVQAAMTKRLEESLHHLKDMRPR